VRELRRRNGSENFKCNLGYWSFGGIRELIRAALVGRLRPPVGLAIQRDAGACLSAKQSRSIYRFPNVAPASFPSSDLAARCD
jgi:hypothetical protein